MKIYFCNSSGAGKSQRRSGQALIVAVLLMLFAVILGATFVTVVSANLNQTARTEAKSEARLAVQAGIEFARFKMQSEGLRWRPKNETPPPQPSDSAFNYYYDEFDRTQSWATNNVPDSDAAFHSDGFVRYPDPRAPQNGGPNFMLKVEKIGTNDADNSDNLRTGDLRFTIIGRSSRNMTAFEKKILYARGQSHNVLVGALRTITNWDFASKTVPSAQIEAVIGNSLTLTKTRGVFPVGGNFYVTIGDPLSNRGLRGAVVESYTSSTQILKLAATVSPVPRVGERIEMAGAIGTSPFVDFNNNGAFETAKENISFDLAAMSASGSSGGVRVNGGLLCFGDTRALQLRAPQNADASRSAATIRASGGVQFMSAPSAPGAIPTFTVAGEYANGGTSRTLSNATILPSNDASFPGAWPNMSAAEKAQLVDDGWNRLANVPSAQRQVAPFAPPDIAQDGGKNLYRRLSEYSKPASSLDPQNAALYGYGEGIYLNNPRDRERVGGGGALREMTQDELRRLWTSHDSTSTAFPYLRLRAPSTRTAANRSLEEQHLRGWIGPDEFRGRGALVEINDDNTIAITLDSRDDGVPSNAGAAAYKGWRDANGNLLGHPTSGGVYRQIFAWPKNGVIFAEGNIRIRGQASAPPRSLTVLSQNNIYIEGSLSAGDKKIALLARRNVVLNPTRVLERNDEQTLLRTAITASPVAPVFVLNVYDASAFQPGDWIFLDSGSSNVQDVCVASVDAANNRLNLLSSTPVRSSQPALRPVRAKSDPLYNGEPATRFNRIERFGQSLQRRFVLPPGAPGEIRVALKHSAERRIAVRVPYINGTNVPATALLGFKIAANATTSLIHRDDKNLAVEFGTEPRDFWGIMRPLAPTSKPTDFHINWLAGPGAIDATNGVLRARTAPLWHYAESSTQLIFNNYGDNPQTTSGLQLPPYYFLAAVGNRPDTLSSGVWPWRPDLKTRTFYEIPMATSVVTTFNGAFSNETASALRSDVWDDTANDFERIGQIGFNPIHGAASPDTNSTDETEDVATVDQSFYVAYGGSPLVPASYTLDSRVLDGARGGSNALALRFNNKIVSGAYRVTDFFNATSGQGQIPFYNLGRIKLENIGLNSAHQIETLAPAQTLDVRAFVYAQQGSWLVIPADWYDANVRNGADLNGDRTVSRAEQIAAYRYHRNNYRLQFRGAIAEKQSAIVHQSGVVLGPVADWTDKHANVSLNASHFSGPTATDIFLDTSSTRNGDFTAISYAYDDEIARGIFDDDSGLHLPTTPENDLM